MPRKQAQHRAEPADVGTRDVAVDYHDDDWVEIYPGAGLAPDTARALLDTAARLGYDPTLAVVAITGGFRVPQLVADTTDFPTEASSTGHAAARTPLAALEAGATPDGADGST